MERCPLAFLRQSLPIIRLRPPSGECTPEESKCRKKCAPFGEIIIIYTPLGRGASIIESEKTRWTNSAKPVVNCNTNDAARQEDGRVKEGRWGLLLQQALLYFSKSSDDAFGGIFEGARDWGSRYGGTSSACWCLRGVDVSLGIIDSWSNKVLFAVWKFSEGWIEIFLG